MLACKHLTTSPAGVLLSPDLHTWHAVLTICVPQVHTSGQAGLGASMVPSPAGSQGACHSLSHTFALRCC